MSEIGKTCTRDEPDIAGADHRDFHDLFLFPRGFLSLLGQLKLEVKRKVT